MAEGTHGPLDSLRETLLCSPTTLVSLSQIFLQRMELNFPGHYIESTSETQNLTWIEIYKADRVADISLTQWLALTPADIAASILHVDFSFIERLKKEKQVLIKGQ